LSRFAIEFDSRTESELTRLPIRIRRQIDLKLEYLSAGPFRSHPGVAVKPTAEVHGAWHFHVGNQIRVYYIVEGATLWVVKVEINAGVDRKALREIRKRL
jgi:mRNA-degrading endonuclease RelE of RelBE toxin-antitoxin system